MFTYVPLTLFSYWEKRYLIFILGETWITQGNPHFLTLNPLLFSTVKRKLNFTKRMTREKKNKNRRWKNKYNWTPECRLLLTITFVIKWTLYRHNENFIVSCKCHFVSNWFMSRTQFTGYKTLCSFYLIKNIKFSKHSLYICLFLYLGFCF